MLPLLKELVLIQSVSGEEKVIFSFIKSYLKKIKVAHTTLKHGDIIIGKQKPKLLLTAHVDEVGFNITSINEDGTASISDIGWVYPWLFPGREVQIQTNKMDIIDGLVLYNKAFDKNIDTWKNLKVDFGFNSKKEMKNKGIIPGIFGTYKKNYWETEHRVFASALDNRLSVAMLLHLLDEMPEIIEQGISIAFTSDEEMDNLGAKKTVPYVDPEYVCVIDIMPHSLLDTPKKLNLSDGPYVLEKTLDYSLPICWKKILKKVRYRPIRGKSKYLKNSEPKMFQDKGYENSINFLTIMANYHHGVYSCQKEAINKSYTALKQVVKTIVTTA